MTDAQLPRTYVRRRGRSTRAQARALETLAARYCLPVVAMGDAPPGRRAAPWTGWADVFGRDGPLGVEVGFGMGQGLVNWAMRCPDWNLLGIEVYQPGIGSLLLGLEAAGADHVRVVEAPAEWVFETLLAPDSVDEVRIFFPDPWPKKRHHKRRLVQEGFVRLVAGRLKPGGLLWLATDVEDYAAWMVEVLDAEPALRRDPDHGDASRPQTRFEARGLRLGHAVRDLRYRAL
jgi:tRNA (guanine-N7-)-methyltransferase